MSWNVRTSRRGVVFGAAAMGLSGLSPALRAAASQGGIRFGLTPVFLNNDLELLARLKTFLSRSTGSDVSLVQRRTYEEITTLLVSGQLTAAWICGYPFVDYRQQLDLVAVPVWRGQSLYQSYSIAGVERPAASLEDLQGDTHAFSDPNSNSGYLVTRALLAEKRLRPDEFFRKTFFTYSHRNVVRAVSSGLADSGSVDGYVWEVLAETEPGLTEHTRIVSRSKWLGFPPVACLARHSQLPQVQAVRQALLSMAQDPDGSAVLKMLRLDGFTAGPPGLFDGIAEQLEQVRRFG